MNNITLKCEKITVSLRGVFASTPDQRLGAIDPAAGATCNIKHAIQNTQNDCHQWLSDSSRVLQIHFWPGLCPGPAGELTALPRPPAGLRGTYFLGERNGGEGKEYGERVTGAGRKEMGGKKISNTPPAVAAIRPGKVPNFRRCDSEATST